MMKNEANELCLFLDQAKELVTGIGALLCMERRNMWFTNVVFTTAPAELHSMKKALTRAMLLVFPAANEQPSREYLHRLTN